MNLQELTLATSILLGITILPLAALLPDAFLLPAIALGAGSLTAFRASNHAN